MSNSHLSSDHQHGELYKQWRVSWLAYLPHAALFIAAIVLTSRDIDSIMRVAALVVAMYTVYRMLYLFRMRLYIDDSGVWLFRGVFPWNRGVYGIRWRDFEDAVFTMGFFYWMTNSYPLALRTRFSQNPTVYIPVIYHGKRAVIEINALAQTNDKIEKLNTK